MPVYDTDIFWSIAHSDDHILVGISRGYHIGVDIEMIRPREASVFDLVRPEEWSLFGAQTIGNFYTLWTAKESIIKLRRGRLDDMPRYTCVARYPLDRMICGLEFTAELVFT